MATVMEETGTSTGLVTTFDLFKGYGFIRRRSGKDLFFFYGDIAEPNNDISAGDAVQFSVIASAKGPRAVQIKRL